MNRLIENSIDRLYEKIQLENYLKENNKEIREWVKQAINKILEKYEEIENNETKSVKKTKVEKKDITDQQLKDIIDSIYKEYKVEIESLISNTDENNFGDGGDDNVK